MPLIRAIETPEMKNVSALTQSATVSASRSNGTRLSSADANSESSANSAAAIGAEPYVPSRFSWLAASSRCRGTRFGIVASLAGIQNRLAASMHTVATMSHQSSPTNGIDSVNAARTKSPVTIVQRRLNRSATMPANGPRTSAGQQLEQQHATDGVVLRGEAAAGPARQRRGQRGDREQPEPVAEAGRGEGEPQRAERLDRQDAAQIALHGERRRSSNAARGERRPPDQPRRQRTCRARPRLVDCDRWPKIITPCRLCARPSVG